MTYREILDSLFEIYDSSYRAGQLEPNLQDNTKDDNPENEDALAKLYDLADKIIEETK